MKISLDRPICFFDLETTGPKVGKDRIVEIAILRVDTNNQESQKVWRINPEMDISFQATQVHGISNQMVRSRTSPLLPSASSGLPFSLGMLLLHPT